ncbi:helix-turn-helix domain-containing protein [Lacticaseibacillus brantae]|uniref:helix-turn-helix domain-containing protein n=1 Tax=Lacticaseibacillus brantae TaxID=943673 RepID=UPI0007090634|nr:helix-turn-helix domain-containing protein [Lacticaseibacillus brantae]
MDLTNFKQLFPHVILEQPFPPDSLVLTIDHQLVALPAADLTAREQALLAPLQTRQHDPWAQFLAEGGQQPAVDGSVRLLIFAVDFSQAQGNRHAWLEALISLLPQVETGFFLNKQQGVVIEPKTAASLSMTDFDGVVSTLDTDFETETHLFVGSFWPVNQALPAIFQEELALATSTSQTVTNLPQTALRYYTTPKREQSPILSSLQTQIQHDYPDMVPVIGALYHHQGNISSAAKALYLHRNTLQYRLDKFQEQTGFALKNMDDLVLCYLLVAN